MANLTVFSAQKLEENNFKIFAGLYNDFKNRAMTDFKFDLEPLSYENFIEAIQNKLLKCIVLTENSIPTGFLVYTDVISFSIELNVIHLISDENFETKIRYLVGEFFNEESELIGQKTVTYPLLGEQEKYKEVLSEFEFNTVKQSVLKFDFHNPSCVSKMNIAKNFKINAGYKISNWHDKYFDNAVKIIHNSFKYSNDAIFDPRFRTFKGVKDIIKKITKSTYGDFLPQYTKLLLKDNKVVGVCFVNVTGNGLVNIPLVAIDTPFRNKKLGERMVTLAVKEVLESSMNDLQLYKEVNVTTDTHNPAAIKMYEYCGFFVDYEYQQSYHEPKLS